MATISAADVKKLRDKTGAGIVDCKKALEKAGGDFAAAERLLKEMGLAAVAKRSGRSADEGRAFTYVRPGAAGILELTCETDFVARNADFTAKGNEIIRLAVEEGRSIEDAGLQEIVTGLATTIKENIQLRRMEILKLAENEVAFDYVHGEAGSIGVIVVLQLSSADLATNPKLLEFGKDLTLHAAAYNPPYLNEQAVPKEYLEEQNSIFLAQVKSMDKPENVIQGIVKGKLSKHLREICFTDQSFVKDEKRSVAKVAEDLGKELGGKIELVAYRAYKAGEEL